MDRLRTLFGRGSWIKCPEPGRGMGAGNRAYGTDRSLGRELWVSGWRSERRGTGLSVRKGDPASPFAKASVFANAGQEGNEGGKAKRIPDRLRAGSGESAEKSRFERDCTIRFCLSQRRKSVGRIRGRVWAGCDARRRARREQTSHLGPKDQVVIFSLFSVY